MPESSWAMTKAPCPPVAGRALRRRHLALHELPASHVASPPPLSSMNSMPAASIARCSFARASSETRGPNPPSSRLTVGRDSPFLPEPRRVRDRDHVRYVAKQPCLVCGRRPSDAHHLRFAQHPAFGRKVSDEFTVPLCRGHHCQIHRCGDEAEWWKKDEAGIRESAKAEAVTRVVAWQLSREMKRQGMSKARLAS